MPSLRLSCVPGRLWMTMRKTPTMRIPSQTFRLAPPSLRAQVYGHFVYFHFTITLISASVLKNLAICPPFDYPSIPRRSDLLFPPQTPLRPILSQERPASLSRTKAKLHLLIAPWAPAATTASSVVHLVLICPSPVLLCYPTSIRAPS